MGCVPLVESLADPRLLAVVAFWVTSGALGSHVLLGKPTEFKRSVCTRKRYKAIILYYSWQISRLTYAY